MSENNSWSNDFIAGLNSDFDPANQPRGTYRESINGRVFFNEQTGSTSWVNALGNTVAFNLAGNYGKVAKGYLAIGGVEFPGILCIFSVCNDTSEIGVVTQDTNGTFTYNTAYNDLYDPNGELLRFSQVHDMQCMIPNVENDQTYRVYFTDYNNIDRVFNIKEGVQKYNPDFVNGDYKPLNTGVYPSYYSAFSMDSIPGFAQGTVKFVQTISGSKLSGVYQYCYRLLTKDGYASPWTMPIRPLFLTSDTVDSGNSQNYAMQASQVATDHGIRIEISGIDIRYNQIQVAYIYSVAPSQSLNAAYFTTQDIAGQTTIIFDDIDNGGTPVALDTISMQFSNIQLTKAMAVREKRLYKMGIGTQPPPLINGSQITVVPHRRTMLGDEVTNSGNQATPFVYTKAYTNTTSQSAYFNYRTSSNQLNTYQINNDYVNNQGMQVNNLYTGYFRNEWYRFGILLFNLQGNPWYVTHVCDIQMPAQYGHSYQTIQINNSGVVTVHNLTNSFPGDFSLTDNRDATAAGDVYVENTLISPTGNPGTDNPRTRELGLLFSNIDLTDVIDQISAFAIVRVERDPTILGQGLILPMVQETGPGPDNNKIRGMGYPSNNFQPIGWWTPTQNDPSSGTTAQVYGKTTTAPYKEAFGYFAFSCPDYIFDNSTLPTLTDAHNIQLVAGTDNNNSDIARGWSPTSYCFGTGDSGTDTTTAGTRTGVIDKNYFTRQGNYHANYLGGISYVFGGGRYQSKMTTWAPFGFDTTQRPFDTGQPTNQLEGYTHVGFEQPIPGMTMGDLYNGGYHQNAICISTTGPGTSMGRVDMISGNSIGSGIQYEVCYALANYIITGKTPYGGVNTTSISQSIFYGTGHFQPVNAKVKADILNSGKYVFNNVEVHGGDCYVNYFPLARVYAQDDNTGTGTGGWTAIHSVAIGNIFPCEMKYNSLLRTPNTWAKSGFRDSDGEYASGVDRYNFEAQDINNVLTYQETNALYAGKPINLTFITDFLQRVYYSNIKIDGELIDSWRQFPVNQFDDVEGVYGAITGAAELFGSIYCIQEKSFGRLRITDRVPIADPATGLLKIGIGGLLDSIEYINTKFGSQHELSIVSTGKFIYWVDVENRAILRFGQNGIEVLSDIKGVHNMLDALLIPGTNYDFSADNPSLKGGIHATYDKQNREVLFTFNNSPFAFGGLVRSLGFSEVNDAFSCHYDWYPTKWMTFNNYLLAFNSLSYFATGIAYDPGVYRMNDPNGVIGTYFSTKYDSLITFVVTVRAVKLYANVSEDNAKVFDVAVINSNNNFLTLCNSLGLVTDITTDTVVPNTDSRARYREGKVWMPLRGLTTAYRTRGQYLIVSMTLHNNGTNLQAVLRSFETKYRISKKI